MLGPADVGHRVVVRRIVQKADDGRPLFGDLIGDLVELGDEHLVLRGHDGTEHRIARTAVVAGKRVPPRPAGRGGRGNGGRGNGGRGNGGERGGPTDRSDRAIAALERVAAQGWPAPDTEPLGEWLLRAADGWTNRANSALAVGDPGRPLAEAIEATIDWYTRRGLTPRITTPLPLASAVAGALASRGWTAQPTTVVQTADLDAIPAADGPEVHLRTAPSPEWLAAVAGHKGSMPAAAHHVLTAPGLVRFAEVPGDGEHGLLANARVVVTGQWLGLSLVRVSPTARRTGLARRMTHVLAGWARHAGATQAYLQVEQDNTPAVALYARLGFAIHHTYVTWRR